MGDIGSLESVSKVEKKSNLSANDFLKEHLIRIIIFIKISFDFSLFEKLDLENLCPIFDSLFLLSGDSWDKNPGLFSVQN